MQLFRLDEADWLNLTSVISVIIRELCPSAATSHSRATRHPPQPDIPRNLSFPRNPSFPRRRESRNANDSDRAGC